LKCVEGGGGGDEGEKDIEHWGGNSREDNRGDAPTNKKRGSALQSGGARVLLGKDFQCGKKNSWERYLKDLSRTGDDVQNVFPSGRKASGKGATTKSKYLRPGSRTTKKKKRKVGRKKGDHIMSRILGIIGGGHSP